MNPYIYKIVNLINGKIYVGKHNGKRHDYAGSGILLRAAYKKYGKENFKKEFLEECSIESLSDREKYWIARLNANRSGIGYNLTEGGDGFAIGELNVAKRPEVCLKLGLKGDANSSRQISVRQKISQTLSGRKLTEEHKNAISKGSKGHRAKRGPDSKLSKSWIVEFPDGHCEMITGLRDFCRRMKLNAKLLRKQEFHKGYRLWPVV